MKYFKYKIIFSLLILIVWWFILSRSYLINAAPWLGFGSYTTRMFLVTGTLTDFGSRWSWTDKFLDCSVLWLSTWWTCTSANIKSALNTTYSACYLRDLEALNWLVTDVTLSTGDYTRLIQKVVLVCPSDTPVYNNWTPWWDYVIWKWTQSDPYRIEWTDLSWSTIVADSCRYYNLNAQKVPGLNNYRVNKWTLSCSWSDCLLSWYYMIDPDWAWPTSPYPNYCWAWDKTILAWDWSSWNPYRYINEWASDATVKAKSCYNYISGFMYHNYLTGFYRIDPDWNGWNTAYNAYCNMISEWWWWTLIINLQTSDWTTRHYEDTTFWTSTTVSWAVSDPFANDYKSDAFNSISWNQIMMRAHDNWIYKWDSVYSLIPAYSNKSFNNLFNIVTNVVVTTSRLYWNWSVWTFWRSNNRWDAFIDRTEPIIINSRFSVSDGDNYIRLSTNYSAIWFTNWHSYAWWWWRHYRWWWGSYFEWAAIHTYCNAQGWYWSNGYAFNWNDAFQWCWPSLVPVDLAVYMR